MTQDTMTERERCGADALQTDAFIPYMRQVARCETSLQELNLMWRLIESSAKMNCPQEAQALLPMMAATRAGFEQLERELVHSMVEQTVAGAIAGLASQAQHIIDTLVRNLYERTADVGFLATDALLCRFAAGMGLEASAIQQRLRAYRSKYTVYREVLLLDVQGQVIASSQELEQPRQSHDPLVARTLQSQGYVQSFGATDLLPQSGSALVYSHRLLHPHTGQPTGVLCLCFDFEGEMQGIWDNRCAASAAETAESQGSIALLVDERNCVLASSDMHWIGVGACVPFPQDGAQQWCTHSGRTYLVQSAASAGYQGYPGPKGWRAQIMVPLDLAFVAQDKAGPDTLDPAVAQGLLAHAQKFCPPLHAINNAADSIRRVVWNGQVMTAGKQRNDIRLQAVLEQIGETGARTNEIFTQSIRMLYNTVLATALRDNHLLTRLLVDFLDRNLYERANDCRWWALTPELSALLEAAAAQGAPAQQVQQVCELLTGIHDLYTVYRQIVVYDRMGRIVAVSLRNEAGDGSPGATAAVSDPWHGMEIVPAHGLIGAQIEADTLAKVLALPDAQSYHVTPWRTSAQELPQTGTQAGPTYVYHAAIRDAAGTVLGGIGLVFHAQRELRAMLDGVLGTQARNSVPVQVCFLARDATVMSSTDERLPAGSRMALPADMLAVPVGQSMARALVYDGQYCVMAVTAGNGYREFKRSDAYREEVLAVAVQAFGPVQDDALAAVWRRNTRIESAQPMPRGQEMATFFVGQSVLAVDAAKVLEAQNASAIMPVSAGRLPYCVGMLARHSQGSVAGYVWVFDLGALLYGKPIPRTPQSQVVVLQDQGLRLGVLVSDLQGVARFDPRQMQAVPALGSSGRPLVDRLIKANGAELLIQCLDTAVLFQVFQTAAAA